MKTEILTYKQKRHAERRLWAIEFLGGKCVECGCDDSGDLEFDHSDPNHRTAAVSSIFAAWSLVRLSAFLVSEKIQLLCTDCHLKKSKLELGKFRV